jgi:Family of unknown function (DUF6174)
MRQEVGMHDRVLRWVFSHPGLAALGVVVLVAEGIAFAAWLAAPWMQTALSGPDPDVCWQAELTQSQRAIAACCAVESWPTRTICEGSAPVRRRQAENARTLEVNQDMRERWEAREPSHYRFSFQVFCFTCWSYSGFTFTSEVTGGVPDLRVTGEGEFGYQPNLMGAGRYSTMEGVFDAVEGAIRGSMSSDVSYSPRWGYPRQVSWGTPPSIVTDSMTTFKVLDFEVLP